MKTDENSTRIALQPETEVEQGLLAELFSRLNNVAEAPSHPEKVGSTVVYYTLDVDMYDDLDHGLWTDAECGVNENGRLDPEPGSRALIVVHGEDEEDEPSQEDIDEAVEMLADDADDPEVSEPPFDPTSRTVDELKDELASVQDAPQLRGIYEAELNGEARKTALEAIEAELDALLDPIEVEE